MPPLSSQPASAARAGGRTQQGRTPAPGQHMPGSFRPPRGSPPQRQAAGTSPSSSPAAPGRRGRRASPGRLASQSARAVRRETGHGSFAPYQAIILAEFVTAELLVAATPIASRPNQPGLSPYVARDLTKLAAIGLAYFLLELLAVGGPGPARIGAWFGGLILLTVGLNEAANIARDLDIFGGGSTGKGGGSSPGQPAPGAAGQFT